MSEPYCVCSKSVSGQHQDTEGEARIMDGTEMLGQDGKPIEPVARRLSKLKQALTDIKLLAPA